MGDRGGKEGGDTSRSRDLLALEHAAEDEDTPSFPGLVLLGGKSKKGNATSKPDISAPVPPSAILAKLQAFMPKIAAANTELQDAMRDRPAEEFDVEHVNDDEGQHIEMDVGLGVVDLKTDEAVAQAEAMAGAAVVGDDGDADGREGDDAGKGGGKRRRKGEARIKVGGGLDRLGEKRAGIEELT